MAEFAIARERAMEDALQGTPVTTAKDMDEVYRELYELKKRVKTLEKRLETENRESGKTV
jgi:polyhydroxyalkanoate synthesis regulator phasin